MNERRRNHAEPDGLWTVEDLNEIRKAIAMLDGKPPYDVPSNTCWNDATFGKSLEEKYGQPIENLRRMVS